MGDAKGTTEPIDSKARGTHQSYRGCTELDRGLVVRRKSAAKSHGSPRETSHRRLVGKPDVSTRAPDAGAAVAPFEIVTPQGTIPIPQRPIREILASYGRDPLPKPPPFSLPRMEDVVVNSIARAPVDLILGPLEVIGMALFTSHEMTPSEKRVTEKISKDLKSLRNRLKPIKYRNAQEAEFGEGLEIGLSTLMTMGISIAGAASKAKAIAALAQRAGGAAGGAETLAAKLAGGGEAIAGTSEAAAVGMDAASELPIIRIRYTEAMAQDPQAAQFLRFNAEWAQSELGGLVRASRVPEDAALRRAARKYLIQEGIDISELQAMHPLDSVGNPFSRTQQMGSTFYFGNKSVNTSFGSQLGTGLNNAGVHAGDRFLLEFVDFPAYEQVGPLAPLSSPPGLRTPRL